MKKQFGVQQDSCKYKKRVLPLCCNQYVLSSLDVSNDRMSSSLTSYPSSYRSKSNTIRNNSICHDNDSGRQGNVRESHKGSSRRYCEPENDETVANYNDDQLLDGGWTI